MEKDFFQISDSLSLFLRDGESVISVAGKPFRSCASLFLNINSKASEEINSIDEAQDEYGKIYGETLVERINPRVIFWAHCSNLQAWFENNYDSRLLHKSLAFPLLKKLAVSGDSQAKYALNREIIERFQSGYEPVMAFLLEENYLNLLSGDELLNLFQNKKILKKFETFSFLVEEPIIIMTLKIFKIKGKNYLKIFLKFLLSLKPKMFYSYVCNTEFESYIPRKKLLKVFLNDSERERFLALEAEIKDQIDFVNEEEIEHHSFPCCYIEDKVLKSISLRNRNLSSVPQVLHEFENLKFIDLRLNRIDASLIPPTLLSQKNVKI